MTNRFDDFLKEQLQDEEFRKEYEALRTERENKQDPFYSKENMNYLKKAVTDIDSGKTELREHALLFDDLKKGLEEAIDYERGGGEVRKTTFPGTVFLEDVMKTLGLTVTDAARMLGVGENTISKFIDEKVAISQEMAIRISEAIGTSVESLMNMQKKDEQTKDLNT